LFEKASADLLREIVSARGQVFQVRQRMARERDALGRLARREVVAISDEMAIRVRDVHNRLARMTDEAAAVEGHLDDLLRAAPALASRKGWI
jgi:Mg2+ and Co2+ transporter CorA